MLSRELEETLRRAMSTRHHGHTNLRRLSIYW